MPEFCERHQPKERGVYPAHGTCGGCIAELESAAMSFLELADAGAINDCGADDGSVAHGLSGRFYKALDKLADALGVSHPAASQEEVS